MTRRNFTAAIILARLEHAGHQCEATLEDGTRCPSMLQRGRYHGDHDIPDQLGGEPTFENCRILCLPCHAAKTAIDQGNIARAKRQEAKHQGVHKQIRPAAPIVGPGFAQSPKAAAKAKRGHRPSLPPYLPRGFVSATER